MAFYGEDDPWKCSRHPSRRWRGGGVCPGCLHERLASLCPDCAHTRPCPCVSVATTSSSSSSSSSLSRFSAGDFFGAAGGPGSMGRVSSLIESEPPFRRSRSMALPFARSNPGQDRESVRSRSRKGSLWWMFKGKKGKEGVAEEDRRRMMMKSKSVAVSESGGGDSRFSPAAKGKGWYFPSPMKALRHSKVSKMVFHQSLPL